MNDNYIIAEINIGEDKIGEKIRIINSYEEVKRERQWYIEEDDYKYKNEKEIKEKCIIKINNKIIPFSYWYNFNKRGK